MSTELLLQYKRVELDYDGVIFMNGVLEVAFKQYTFAEMMTTLHNALVSFPEAQVKLQRAESANFLPIFMEQNMVDLLRTDPAKYIEAHTIPHRVIDLRKQDRTSKLAEKHVVPSSVIRAGHDTLAAAFGEVVYLSYRNNRVENPFTGRWCSLAELETTTDLKVIDVVQQEKSSWVTVSMEQLLRLDPASTGYYLPREWNDNGPWISKVELYKKYSQYQKDKEQCLAATATQKTH